MVYKRERKRRLVNIESSKKGDPKVAIERLEKAYGASGASSQSKIDPAAKSQLESTLGASYPGFEKSVGKVKSVYERTDAGTLVISGAGGELVVDKDAGEDGIREANRFVNGKLVETTLTIDGQRLASQKAGSNVLQVGDASYNLPKGKNVADLRKEISSEKGLKLPGEEGEPSGLLQLKDGVFTAIDYEEETLQRIKPNGESENLKGDRYKKGVSGCKTDGGCFVETGGEITIKGVDGNLHTVLVDVEYDTPFGADRVKEKKTLFDPSTGRKNGIILLDDNGNDKTIITKVDTKDGEPTTSSVKDVKTGTIILAKKVNDNWVPVSSPTSPKLQELKVKKGENLVRSLAATQIKLEEARTKEETLKNELNTAHIQGNTDEEVKLSGLLAGAQAERNTLEEETGKLETELSEINTELSKEQQAATKAEDDLSNTLKQLKYKEALDELDFEETLAGIDKF